MGMTNQLANFSHKITELTQPLRDLLSKGNSWIGAQTDIQGRQGRTGKIFNTRPVQSSCPNQNFSRRLLFQCRHCHLSEGRHNWHLENHSICVVIYVWYGKEVLADRERSTCYNIGLWHVFRIHTWKKIFIEMDHKPLVCLLSKKNFNSLPFWILCFCLRMIRFHYSITHAWENPLYCWHSFKISSWFIARNNTPRRNLNICRSNCWSSLIYRITTGQVPKHTKRWLTLLSY